MEASLLRRTNECFAAIEPYIFGGATTRLDKLHKLLYFSHVPRGPQAHGLPALAPKYINYNTDHSKQLYVGGVQVPVHVLYNDLSAESIAALSDESIVSVHITSDTMDAWMTSTVQRLNCTELELAEFAGQGLSMRVPNPCFVHVFRKAFPLSQMLGLGGLYDSLVQGGCDTLYRVAQTLSNADRQHLADLSRRVWTWPTSAWNLLYMCAQSCGTCLVDGEEIVVDGQAPVRLADNSGKLRLLLLICFTRHGRDAYNLWRALRPLPLPLKCASSTTPAGQDNLVDEINTILAHCQLLPLQL